MPKQIRVNIRTRVNNADIRQETRDGRQVIIVPSKTLPDNIVMNGGLYPADEIASSFHSLEGTLAPVGHPMVNGQYVSALHPEALTGEYQPFARNENVRRQNGVVLLDKVIDVANAEKSEKGQRVIAAINEKKPIHTSTGIMLEREPVQNADGHDWIARNMCFDHDCILLDQPGAATPEQGVGMMVNAEGQPVEIDVINAELTDDLMQSFENIEENEHNTGLIANLMKAFRSVLQSEQATGLLTSNCNGEDTMTPEQHKELMDAINSLKQPVVNAEDQAKATGAAIAEAVKPLVDAVNALQADKVAAAEAEKAALVDAVVNANVLDKVTAESMTVNQLKPLAEKFGKPGAAAGINGAFQPNNGSKSQWDDYDMNANLEDK